MIVLPAIIPADSGGIEATAARPKDYRHRPTVITKLP
jgi:hypothetical protein